MLATFQYHFAINNLDVILENTCKDQSMGEKDNIYGSLLLFQEHQKKKKTICEFSPKLNQACVFWFRHVTQH